MRPPRTRPLPREGAVTFKISVSGLSERLARFLVGSPFLWGLGGTPRVFGDVEDADHAGVRMRDNVAME